MRHRHPRAAENSCSSNNGSLYLGNIHAGQLFASERFPLKQLGCHDIQQVRDPLTIDIPVESGTIDTTEWWHVPPT